MKKERKSRNEEKKKYSDNYVKKWQTVFNNLKEHSSKTLTFDDITIDWMEDHEIKLGAKLNKDTSLPVHMAKIHQMLVSASKRKLFDVSQIEGYQLPVYKNPARPYHTLDEVDAIWDNLDKYTPTEREVALFYLIECLSGLRFSDWHRFITEKLISKNRIKVSAKKNGEPVYLPYDKSPRLKRTVEYIKENKMVFNHAEKTANECLKEIGKKCKIKIKMTTHVGRHTFATLMLEHGYSKETIAEWMAVSIRTVDIYAKAIRNEANKEYEEKGGL